MNATASSPLRIAVTGLHRGENPQPGSSIIKSLRRRYPQATIIGLVYDAMESGIYVEDGPDEVHVMPFPSAGASAYLDRLDQIREHSPFDLFLPTLDAEIELLVHLHRELEQRGLRTCLPDRESLAQRSKARLAQLADACDVATPQTHAVHDVASALAAAETVRYPVMVKGAFYEARFAATPAALSHAVSALLAEWGSPAIIQERISGPEFNALGIGDGQGGIHGLTCIRKTLISDQGKGLGGITIHNPQFTAMCGRLITHLRWRGPFEIEAMKDDRTGELNLIEINPRFPAWVDFPAALGTNHPAALIDLLTGSTPGPLPACPTGRFYVRHQVEVIGSINQLAALASTSDLGSTLPSSTPSPSPVSA